MKTHLFFRKLPVLGLLISCLLFNGCVLFAVGAAGAAGGYAISQDEMEGLVKHSYSETWKVSYRVMAENGIIHFNSQTMGKIQIEYGETKATLQLLEMPDHQIRIRVKARKFSEAFPDQKFAKKILNQIMTELLKKTR